MTDLNQAREWADRVSMRPATDREHAAAEIIQSLPDQWVDVEKVREIIADMDLCLKMESTSDFSKGIDNATTSWRDALKALIYQKLPTLADLTEEERKACVGMQADYSPLGKPVERVAIVGITDFGAMLMSQNWERSHREAGRITPLPGEQKLEWPGSGDEPTIAQKEKVAPDQAIAKDVCNSEPNSSETPKSSIKPEDVPAGEPWIVEYDGIRHVGAREKGAVTYPDWALARLDGTECIAARDAEITLVSRLVPESHTLPEGMRLADHETLGRIVVSQRADEDGDYAFFESIPGGIAGASWGYVNESELTFLGGEA